MAPKTKFIIVFIIGLLAGDAIVYFTHSIWCQNQADPVNNTPIFEHPAVVNTELIQGKPLTDTEHNTLIALRKSSNPTDTAHYGPEKPDIIPTPAELSPCPDNSFSFDPVIAWHDTQSVKLKTGEIRTVTDSGYYRITGLADCITSRIVNLKVETTPRHSVGIPYEVAAAAREAFFSAGIDGGYNLFSGYLKVGIDGKAHYDPLDLSLSLEFAPKLGVGIWLNGRYRIF